MMMSALQDAEGLTKELYFIILSRRKTSFSMDNSRFNVYMHGLPVLTFHYNVLSGLIIIRSKRVNGKIICLCTRSEETIHMQISSLVLLWLLSYASS